jgi:hypothetical protein
MRMVYPLCVALAVAAALAGCGGSGNEEAAVEDVIRTAVLSNDAAKCTEVMTAALREELSGKSGADALSDCKEEAVEDKHDTKAVEVFAIQIEGDRATAEAAYAGGTFGGQTLQFSLVKGGGRWKIDQATRITKFDRKAFLAGAAVSLTDAEEASPDQQRCIVGRLGEESRGEIEDLLLHGSQAGEIELARACPNSDYHLPENVEIAKAIDGIVRATEPSACLEFATQRYLESASGEHGVAAISACVQQVEGAPVLEQDIVSGIRVSGPRATAKVVLRSKATGEVGLISGLVREHGHWKVDSVVRLLSLDRLAYAKGILQGLTESGVEVNRTVSACVLAKMRRLSLRRLEDLLLPLDTALSARIFGPCAQAGGEAPPPT